MIKESTQNILKDSKNLLAFSAGVDSSALFFILLEMGISFDIAIVNYGLREQSKDEVAYAQKLAKKYNKKIFLANAPKFNSNFEANARDFRYSFFQEIISKNGYTVLLTAHQLNDKLEWLLMGLVRGAGLSELSGMQEISTKENYQIIRPLLEQTKDDLLDYLNRKNYNYFIDSSNFETKYQRNRFRPISDTILEFGKNGVNRSFEILEQESKYFKESFKTIFAKDKLRVLKLKSREFLPYATSYTLKELGYLLSGKERDILKIKDSIVAGRKWAIEYSSGLLYIAPYVKTVIAKEQKEIYRIAKIPPKIRGYCFSENVSLEGLI